MTQRNQTQKKQGAVPNSSLHCKHGRRRCSVFCSFSLKDHKPRNHDHAPAEEAEGLRPAQMILRRGIEDNLPPGDCGLILSPVWPPTTLIVPLGLFISGSSAPCTDTGPQRVLNTHLLKVPSDHQSPGHHQERQADRKMHLTGLLSTSW